MKTYTGTVLGARCLGVDTSVQVKLTTGPVLSLRASTRTAIEAIVLIGRRVRFEVELDVTGTMCLSKPVFVIGSEFGLRALSVADV